MGISESTYDLLEASCGREFSETLDRFIRRMVDRMIMSSYKYGPVTAESVKREAWDQNIALRLERFRDTGNTEWLVDAANFLVIMSTFPCHPAWHFASTGSEESPGIVVDGLRIHGPDDLPAAERHLRRQQREGD